MIGSLKGTEGTAKNLSLVVKRKYLDFHDLITVVRFFSDGQFKMYHNKAFYGGGA